MSAVVEGFYPNQAGARAIGPALFGETNRWGGECVCVMRVCMCVCVMSRVPGESEAEPV